jgi:hypothetical protein
MVPTKEKSTVRSYSTKGFASRGKNMKATTTYRTDRVKTSIPKPKALVSTIPRKESTKYIEELKK